MKDFRDELFYSLIGDTSKRYDNNVDYFYPGNKKPLIDVRRVVNTLAHKMGFIRRKYMRPSDCLRFTLANLEQLERVYASFGDEYSQDALVNVLRFRILGSDHVKTVRNTPEYWELRKRIKRYLKENNVAVDSYLGPLSRYQIGGLSCICHPLNVLNTFLVQQYQYHQGNAIVALEDGDVVLDCGGGLGDTAIHFADIVGDSGHVYCFEFVNNNLELIEKNLSENGHLRSRVTLVQKALWSTSGETLSFSTAGPASRVSEHGASKVTTVAIDDMNLGRVDFIKMDIEGAEPQALQGAENVLRQYRPKLAISLYHKNEDFVQIPAYLTSLDLGYEFFLDHFSIRCDETMLFARAV